jgi:hypothetical protein
MSSVRRLERKLGRAVSWEPTHDVFFRFADMLSTSRRVPPLYVAQAALRSVETALRAGGFPIPFGLLAGSLCVCPRTDQEYLLIDEVIPARLHPGAAYAPDDLVREMRGVARGAASRGRLPLGWYQGDADVLELVAREDVALHCAMFPEPWQVMLLRDGVDGLRHGSFVRIEPTDRRPYAIRFFELQPDSALSSSRGMRTVIRWENYQTDDPVLLLDDRERPAFAPRRSESLLDRLRARWTTPRDTIPRPNGVRHYIPEFHSLGDRDSTDSALLRPMKPADLPTPPATPSVSDQRPSVSPDPRPDPGTGGRTASGPESIGDFINFLRDRTELPSSAEVRAQSRQAVPPPARDVTSTESRAETNGQLRPNIRSAPDGSHPLISPNVRAEPGSASPSEPRPDGRPENRSNGRPVEPIKKRQRPKRETRPKIRGDSKQETPRSPISVPRIFRERSSPLAFLKKMLRAARRLPPVADAPASLEQSLDHRTPPAIGKVMLADVIQQTSTGDNPIMSSGSHPVEMRTESESVRAASASHVAQSDPAIEPSPRPALASPDVIPVSDNGVGPLRSSNAPGTSTRSAAADVSREPDAADVAELLLANLMKSLSMPTATTELPDFLQAPKLPVATVSPSEPVAPPLAAEPQVAAAPHESRPQEKVSDAQKIAIDSYRNSAVTTEVPRASDPVELPKVPPPVEIRLAADRTTMNSGESLQLLPSVIDGSGNVIPNFPFTFSSSDPGIVAVWSTGTATSVGPAGTVEVTVRAANLTRVVRLTVVAETTFLDVRPNPMRLQQLGARQLDARALEAYGLPLATATFTYTSSDLSIVTVSLSGLVQSVGPAGVASITVQSDRVVVEVQIMVVHVPTRIVVTPNPTHVFIGKRRRLRATMIDAVGEVMNGPPFEFISSNPAVLEVSSEGVLTAAGRPGDATITVRARRTSISADIPVRVVEQAPAPSTQGYS